MTIARSRNTTLYPNNHDLMQERLCYSRSSSLTGIPHPLLVRSTGEKYLSGRSLCREKIRWSSWG